MIRTPANRFVGFLYDVFIYTGPESPINTPWWGLRDLLAGGRLGGDGKGAVRDHQLVQMGQHSEKDMV